MFKNGEFVLLENNLGKTSTPSCIMLNQDNNYQIGDKAYTEISRKPAAVVHSIKQILSKDIDDQTVKDMKEKVAFSIVPDAQNRALIEINQGDTKILCYPLDVISRFFQEMLQIATK